MEITTVDPYDEAAFAAWHETHTLSEREGRRFATPSSLQERAVDYREPGLRRENRAYAGTVDGVVVCAGSLGLPLLDNRNIAQVDAHTHPAHRGRGYAGAMVAHLEAEAAAAGRDLLNAEMLFPIEAPEDGAGEENVGFATRRGYVCGLSDLHQVLDLPVPDARLDALAEAAAPHHAAYRLESFVGAVPERWLTSFVELDASLMSEAPGGDLEFEPEAADVEAHREMERQLEAKGRLGYHTVALDEAGDVVAYTTLMISGSMPDTCFQWGTLVRPDTRGHRLGAAVKVANQRRLQAERAGLRQAYTFNSVGNTYMVSVNEALGYRPVERLGWFQKRLGSTPDAAPAG